MAGRKAQPLTVVQGTGKKHLTKAEIAKRRAIEAAAKGDTDKVKPPRFLTEPQKKEFKRLAEELLKIDIIQNLDVNMLVMFVQTWEQYNDVVKAIECAPMGQVYNSLQRTKDLLFSQCMRAANELGLTFSARMKMAQPKVEEKPESKFAKFGN